jgi:predicted DNA-binding transcriptional regulator YafY
MTIYQENLYKILLSNKTFDEIIEMSWKQMEEILDQKISKNTYKLIINKSIEEEVDKKFMDLIPLFESTKDISTIKSKIISAIKNRWYLAVYYEDDEGNKGFRLIEPYVVGRGYKVSGVVSKEHKDDYYLRCYIIKDAKVDPSVMFNRNKSYSFSEEEPYWRIFRLDRILNLTVIKRKIRYYRREYTGGSDENIVERMEWANINDFAGENSFYI